jgi:hypothetical protein
MMALGLALVIVMIALSACSKQHADITGGDGIEAAKHLFAEYVTLEKAFDSSICDLYSDQAVIKLTKTYPDGKKKKATLTGSAWKLVIRTAMPLAKQLDDTNEYYDVEYVVEGDNVRINATRHSNRKNYDAPTSILVGKNNDGKWLIIEEIVNSQE